MANVAMPGRRAGEGTVPTLATKGKIGCGVLARPAKGQIPDFLKERAALFDKWVAEQEEVRRAKAEKADKIVIQLPDGSQKEGKAFETTPMDVAKSISSGLANAVIVAKLFPLEKGGKVEVSEDDVVDADDDEAEEEQEEISTLVRKMREMGLDGGNGGGDSKNQKGGKLWDMCRPLEASCRMQLLKFDDAEGQEVFFHSSAHVLGQALEREFGCHLTIGPALTTGFYYDAYLGEGKCVVNDDYKSIEEQVDQIVKEGQSFHRLVLSKEQALELFKANPFKVALITSKIPEGGKTTCYKCGTLVDLCRGPHIPSTARVKGFAVQKTSAAYWLGQADSDSLQRVYGVAFPEKKQLKDHQKLLEEAEKRDHREIGAKQQLFFFDNVTPGSCFWLPYGTRLYNKLQELMKSEYRLRGFDEVVSPNIFSCDLWKRSGHYQNYKENMYTFECEKKEWGLKPMNCPGHCLMFAHLSPSYKQLPIRLADFGVLHRNEFSGSLSGLTRVRRFQQDDAHIFCRRDQIKKEVMSALDFLFHVYGVFGFTFDLKLSTRPKKALGDIELWDEAELALKEALDETGRPWSLNVGDGAFYGPKIDIKLEDALKRWHQCGTIQLDFQLPIRFNLQYKTDQGGQIKETAEGESNDAAAAAAVDAAAAAAATSGECPCNSSKKEEDEYVFVEQPIKAGHARPVIIHRAILGSIERMAAILVEHTGGRFPFWLNPKQVMVCPISDKVEPYVKEVRDILHNAGLFAEADLSSNTLQKKLLNAQHQQWNYMIVIGEKEMNERTATLRLREDPKDQQTLPLDEAVKFLVGLNRPPRQDKAAQQQQSNGNDMMKNGH